jgi:hypothetical protein
MKTRTSQPRLSLVLASEGAVSQEYGTTPTKKARTPTKRPEPSRDPRRTSTAVAKPPLAKPRHTPASHENPSDNAAEVGPTCGVREEW